MYHIGNEELTKMPVMQPNDMSPTMKKTKLL